MGADSKTGNLILDALDAPGRGPLLRDAELLPIDLGKTFAEPGSNIDTVMFPVSGVLALVAVTPDGHEVESATIGREGIGGVYTALGSRTAAQLLVGQIEGEMLVVGLDAFLEEVRPPGRLQYLVHGYIEALFAQTCLSVACNAIHHLHERCARWLLTTHDRVDTDSFALRQEFLAAMLGVRRPSVSIAAGALQEAGFIEYHRGQMTITDREGLEGAACSCYESIRSEYSRLVPLRPFPEQTDSDNGWKG